MRSFATRPCGEQMEDGEGAPGVLDPMRQGDGYRILTSNPEGQADRIMLDDSTPEAVEGLNEKIGQGYLSEEGRTQNDELLEAGDGESAGLLSGDKDEEEDGEAIEIGMKEGGNRDDEKKVAAENSPKGDRMPWKILFVIYAVIASDAIALTLILPFVPGLVNTTATLKPISCKAISQQHAHFNPQ